MDKKNPIINKSNYIFLFLFFIYIISLVNCIIEIPIKIVEVNNIGNNKYIQKEETKEYQKIISLKDETEGSVLLNSAAIFVATVKIGSNNQQFNLALDTGSPDLWVAKEGSIDTYTINNHFNPSESLTCVNTKEHFMLLYGTSTISSTEGFYYKDNVTFLADNSFYMKFGVAEETEFNIKNTDGLIGLAHYYKDESLSFMEMLCKANNINTHQFSFKFPLNAQLNKTMGQFFIGKHKDFESNKTITCPLLHLEGDYKLYWSCEINGLGLKNKNGELTMTKSFNKFIFDTGTNLVVLPLEFFNKIENDLNKINCKKIEINNVIKIECQEDDLPSLTFNISGAIFTLPPRLFFTKEFRSRFYFTNTDYYAIGSPFFLLYHTLFDKDNEVIQIYNDNNETINTKTDNKNSFPYIYIILIIILSVIIIGAGVFIVYFGFIKNKKEEKEIKSLIPNCDYNINDEYDDELLN